MIGPSKKIMGKSCIDNYPGKGTAFIIELPNGANSTNPQLILVTGPL